MGPQLPHALGDRLPIRLSGKCRGSKPDLRGVPLKERRVSRDLAYFFFAAFVGLPACASLSAAPRMSPSEAPESDEPYCATACFSSAICRAFTEKLGFFERSNPITIASSFW